MPLFVRLRSPGPDWQEGVPYREQPGGGRHVAFAQTLLDEGRLVVGGPFTDAGSGGLHVLRVDSVEEATEVAHRDPTLGTLLRVEVRPWRMVMASDDVTGHLG